MPGTAVHRREHNGADEQCDFKGWEQMNFCTLHPPTINADGGQRSQIRGKTCVEDCALLF